MLQHCLGKQTSGGATVGLLSATSRLFGRFESDFQETSGFDWYNLTELILDWGPLNRALGF